MGSWRTRMGMLLAAIWLILTGLIGLGVAIPGILMNLLAIAAGVVLLMEGGIGSGRRGSNRNWGLTLLAVWLILMGLFSLLALTFVYQGLLMAILALAAGVLLLMGR